MVTSVAVSVKVDWPDDAGEPASVQPEPVAVPEGVNVSPGGTLPVLLRK